MAEHIATKLLLDPWSAEYSGSVLADPTEPPQTDVQIDAFVETQRWTAIPSGEPPDSAAFVDGVRRIEARVIGVRKEGMVHGLFGSFATGATIVNSHTAQFAHCVPTRRLILTSGLLRSEVFRIGSSELRFEGLSVPEGNPDALLLALQAAMREAEQTLARALPAPLVFPDGPIAFTTEAPGPVIGVVKTIHRLYLPSEQMEVALRLKTSEQAGVWNAQVLLRELRDRGYGGGYTILRPQWPNETTSPISRNGQVNRQNSA